MTVVFEEEILNMGTAPESKRSAIYFHSRDRKSPKNLRAQIRDAIFYINYVEFDIGNRLNYGGGP